LLAQKRARCAAEGSASIKRSSVTCVREVPLREAFRLPFFALRLGNRLGSICVLLERDTGIFRKIVITPNDPKAFLNAMLSDPEGFDRRTP
jgi:hypothetical protein